MGRYDFDDARSQDGSSARSSERGEMARRDPEKNVQALPDRVQSRIRDGARGGREHDLTLPAGRDREHVRDGTRDYHLRGSEVDLLEGVARYRAVFTEDLKHDSGDGNRFRDDLRSLQRQGLIEERTVTRLRDHTVTDVVSVTPTGKALLDHHRDPERDVGQVYYAGWVKPAEVWHDASLFRMVREMEQELERYSGNVRRVVLDDELKATAFRAIHEEKSKRRTNDDAHRMVAEEYRLHLDGDRFVFPDVRLEVEDRDGTARYGPWTSSS